MTSFRLIPSIDLLLDRPALGDAISRYGRAAATEALREAASELREALRAHDVVPAPIPPPADPAAWIEAQALMRLDRRTAPSLRQVINATGVILHTNLGRAPLARHAALRAAALATGYSNLEYDLASGTRGHRHAHAEALLTRLTGAEAAVVVNNNAAATLLVLAAIAPGREVIVSRGELVEIGGGFRVPDVMAQSGALLREVGTTNRTRVADYAAAISDKTGLLLRVHPSNFATVGFTERPPLASLAELARKFDLPVFEDLGSGWLGLSDVPAMPALAEEPSVRSSLAAGVDLVAFSGDKLLGGPQAGIVLGRRTWVDRLRRHPLMRAVRADKVTYALLEATLGLWAEPDRRQEIPVYRMLTMSVETIDRRARALRDRLCAAPGLDASIADGVSTVGGGSAPASALPTRLISLGATDAGAAALAARLRAADPPVVARVEDERVLLDLRTVDVEDIDLLESVVITCAGPRARS